ncbi:MAG: flippase-like domain-containing protein [Chitinophagaceae bacterium]|nr:flippase-like domain-containing protein [Chitinophagaceae bacterium]
MYNQIRHQPDLPLAWQQTKNAVAGSGAWQLWLAVFLMPLNWSIESYKWYVLVNKFQKLSFVKSFEAVLSGLSLAMNTPNRIGEYGGRVLYLQPEFRYRGVALTILCSVSQLFVTLVVGFFSLLILKPQLQSVHFSGTALTDILLNVFLYAVLAMAVVTGLFYFRLQWLVKVMKWIPFVKEKFSFAFVPEHLKGKTMVKILFYSFLRFMVFAAQYVLLWKALNAGIDAWQGFWCIALVFLIMAIVPSFAIAEIGIRGKVALSIAGLFSVNSLAILAGTVGIWLLNLVLPALTGSLFLLTVKIFKER